jgi:hypothetical protein
MTKAAITPPAIQSIVEKETIIAASKTIVIALTICLPNNFQGYARKRRRSETPQKSPKRVLKLTDGLGGGWMILSPHSALAFSAAEVDNPCSLLLPNSSMTCSSVIT